MREKSENQKLGGLCIKLMLKELTWEIGIEIKMEPNINFISLLKINVPVMIGASGAIMYGIIDKNERPQYFWPSVISVFNSNPVGILLSV